MSSCSAEHETRELTVGRHGARVRIFSARVPVAEACFEFSGIEGMERWCACWRRDACWMTPATGDRWSDVPRETQMLLVRTGALHTLYLPLIGDRFRASLEGGTEANLRLRVESGCPDVKASEFAALYIHRSEDPYSLMKEAAEDLKELRGVKEPAQEPERPDFAERYGWCSWNAFYEEVTEDKLLGALERLVGAGIRPGFVIVDGGWQETREGGLAGLGANREKFPGGIGRAIDRIKADCAVNHVFLWQAYGGYWRGLDPVAFPDAIPAKMEPPARLIPHEGEAAERKEAMTDTISSSFYPVNLLEKTSHLPPSWERFCDNYHRAMKEAGADAVKIDAISWIEAFGKGRGGRVAIMRDFLCAAEKSVARHFGGRAVWCSSGSNDFLFQTGGRGVVRTSIDFFPDQPESHGLHLYANAINSLFMGAFLWPDWDMFQSGMDAEAANFHAAARALSGGPVYAADAVGEENFDLLRKLVLPDGRIPLCETYARPALDTLYADPSESLLKIFNHNRTARVLGIFNASYPKNGDGSLSGTFCLSDAAGPGLKPEGPTAVFLSHDGALRRIDRDEALAVTLPPLGFQIATFSEIRDGFAPFGDPGLFNPAGVIRKWEHGEGRHRVRLLPGRDFLAYAERAPKEVRFSNRAVPFDYAGSRLSVALPEAKEGDLLLCF